MTIITLNFTCGHTRQVPLVNGKPKHHYKLGGACPKCLVQKYREQKLAKELADAPQ